MGTSWGIPCRFSVHDIRLRSSHTMPFDVGGAVNAAADWLCGSALVKGIVNNPIFTALLLTAIAIVIILGMYYREFRSGGKKKMIRMTIYLLFAVAIVVFVHHYAVERCI